MHYFLQNSDSPFYPFWWLLSLLTLQFRMFKTYLLLLIAGQLVPKFHFLSPWNLFCYLQVFLYPLRPRACSHIAFTSHVRLVVQLTKKKNREESGEWSEIVQIGRWRDSFSSVFCTLIKHALSIMRTLVTSEICYKTKCKNLIMNIVWRNQHTTSRYMMDAVISNKLNQH